MVFRKVPDYIVKARASYQLQRGVPCDCQSHVGKKQWKEPGGTTLKEAHARGLRKRVRDEKGLCSNSVAVLAWLWITLQPLIRCRMADIAGRKSDYIHDDSLLIEGHSASSATSRDGGVDWTRFVKKISFLAQLIKFYLFF